MKKLAIIVFIVLMVTLLGTSAYAISFCLDYLEAGNPGGQTFGLKTCDFVNPVEISLNDTFSIDIWLTAVPESPIASGFFMDYNPSKLSLISLEVYGEDIPDGPWTAPTCKHPDALGPGSYWLFLPSIGGTTPQGGIILAKATFQYITWSVSDITFWSSFEEDFHATVTGSGFVYDTEIVPTSITIGNDSDEDCIVNSEDNCPTMPNGPCGGTCTAGDFCAVTLCNSNSDCGVGGFCSKNQEDSDGDGIGDACEFCEANFDCDFDVDGADASQFKLHFGRSKFLNPCTNTNTCKGDFDCDTDVDGTDASLFKSDFGRNTLFNVCPSCNVCPWCVYP